MKKKNIDHKISNKEKNSEFHCLNMHPVVHMGRGVEGGIDTMLLR